MLTRPKHKSLMKVHQGRATRWWEESGRDEKG